MVGIFMLPCREPGNYFHNTCSNICGWLPSYCICAPIIRLVVHASNNKRQLGITQKLFLRKNVLITLFKSYQGHNAPTNTFLVQYTKKYSLITSEIAVLFILCLLRQNKFVETTFLRRRRIKKKYGLRAKRVSVSKMPHIRSS